MSQLFALDCKSAITIQAVLKVLRGVRIKEAGLQESEIRDRLHVALQQGGLPSKTEVKFGPGCRADIWINGVVVEVKKKRPDRASVTTQLHRYANQEGVTGIILVLERSILLPEEIEGTPISILSLNSLWGIAL